MVDWKDVEDESSSNFLKFVEGMTKIEFITEPKKIQDKFNNTKYKANVFANSDKTKVMEMQISPMLLHEIGVALKSPSALQGKVVTIVRTGTTKEDTKYKVVA